MIGFKSLLRVIGRAAFVLASVFLVVQLIRYRQALADTLTDTTVIGLVLACAAAYAALLVALATAWVIVARGFAGLEPGARTPADDLRRYAICNVYKYLPGNIFHLVSRQAAFAREGLSQADIAKTSLVEILLHIFGVATVCLAAFALTGHASGGLEVPLAGLVLSPRVTTATLAGAALAGLVAAWLLSRPTAPIRAAGLNLVFFLGYGLLLLAIFPQLDGAGASAAGTLVAGYLVAWLAGFLTPGAPGGLGVREAVFIAFVPETPELAVQAAVLGRLISSLGDLLFPVLTRLLAAAQRSASS